LEKRGHDLKNDLIVLSRKGVSLKGLRSTSGRGLCPKSLEERLPP